MQEQLKEIKELNNINQSSFSGWGRLGWGDPTLLCQLHIQAGGGIKTLVTSNPLVVMLSALGGGGITLAILVF